MQPPGHPAAFNPDVGVVEVVGGGGDGDGGGIGAHMPPLTTPKPGTHSEHVLSAAAHTAHRGPHGLLPHESATCVSVGHEYTAEPPSAAPESTQVSRLKAPPAYALPPHCRSWNFCKYTMPAKHPKKVPPTHAPEFVVDVTAVPVHPGYMNDVTEMTESNSIAAAARHSPDGVTATVAYGPVHVSSLKPLYATTLPAPEHVIMSNEPEATAPRHMPASCDSTRTADSSPHVPPL